MIYVVTEISIFILTLVDLNYIACYHFLRKRMNPKSLFHHSLQTTTLSPHCHSIRRLADKTETRIWGITALRLCVVLSIQCDSGLKVRYVTTAKNQQEPRKAAVYTHTVLPTLLECCVYQLQR
jgi:hypothetical protein